jgi:hypothetical protein
MNATLADRRRAHLRVLACVARADGRVTIEEAGWLLGAFTDADLSADERAELELALRAGSLDVQATLQEATRGTSPELLAALLRDAYIVAGADGELVAEEVALADALLGEAGIAELHRPALQEWARRAADLHLDGLTLLKQALPTGGDTRQAGGDV